MIRLYHVHNVIWETYGKDITDGLIALGYIELFVSRVLSIYSMKSLNLSEPINSNDHTWKESKERISVGDN